MEIPYKLCSNKECPSNNSCLRSLKIPDVFYYVEIEFKPDKESDRCIYFIDKSEIESNGRR